MDSNSNLYLQKTNWGTLRILPEICVNRFGKFGRSNINWKRSRAFFLTHCDDDLMYDVINRDFLNMLKTGGELGPRLFMHRLVLAALKHWIKNHYDAPVDQLNHENVLLALEDLEKDKKIIPMDINVPVELQFLSKGGCLIKVTPLSAGSEIGSIMLLLETEINCKVIRVLYTGNCRLIGKDLRGCKALHNLDGTPKRLSKIFVDTSYCTPTVQELPCRAESIFDLVDVLAHQRRINSSYRLRFNFTGGKSGSSVRALYHIAEEFGRQIHTPKHLSEHLNTVPGIALRFVARDAEEDDRRPFHYGCENNHLCDGGPEADGDIRPTKEIRVELGCDVHSGSHLYEFTEAQHHWLNGKMHYLSEFGSIHQLYASHLSRYELGRLINYFDVDSRDVVPLYKARRMPTYMLKNLIRATCSTVKDIPEPSMVRQDVYSTWYDCTYDEKMHLALMLRPETVPLQFFTFQ